MRNKRKILTGIEVELLDLELDFIKSVCLESGYPFEVTQLTIRAAKVIQFAIRVVQLQKQKEPLFVAEK